MSRKQLSKKPIVTIQDIYQQQADFVHSQLVVQWMLNQWVNDKRNFEVFIEDDVREYYRFNQDNPEIVWEACSCLVDDAITGTWGDNKKKRYIGLKACGGLIAKIAFVAKKDRITVEQLGEYVCNGDFSCDFPPEKTIAKTYKK